jgi:hypothetical protein
MNPNCSTDLVKAYRADDIQAANEWRRRHAVDDGTPSRLDASSGAVERPVRMSLAVVRRLLPRGA